MKKKKKTVPKVPPEEREIKTKERFHYEYEPIVKGKSSYDEDLEE